MTANQRLKSRSPQVTRGSVLLGAAVHALVLIFWPRWDVEWSSERRTEYVQLITVPPAVSLEVAEIVPRPGLESPADEERERSDLVVDLEAALRDRLAVAIPITAADAPVGATPLAFERLPDPRPTLVSEIAPIAWPRIRNPRRMESYLRARSGFLGREMGITSNVVVALWVDERGQVDAPR